MRKPSNSDSQNQGRGVWVPAFAGTTQCVLIPPAAIDDVFQRAAGFKAFDLLRDVF